MSELVKMQGAAHHSSVSVGGEEYVADGEGVVEVPARFAGTLETFGFRPYVAPAKAAPKPPLSLTGKGKDAE
jgi:hypothetical protein